MPERRGVRLALVFGVPCLTAAVTAAFLFAAYFVRLSVPFAWGQRAFRTVVCLNMAIAFFGATAGGLTVPGGPVRRSVAAVATGVCGAVLHVAIVAGVAQFAWVFGILGD